MLTIHAGHSVTYLTDAVATGRESYYLDATAGDGAAAGEPPGRWSGAGAAVLGLSGEVDADTMSMIYNHLVDPRDPHAGSPAEWGLAETLGRPHKSFRSAEDIYRAALGHEPHATPARRAELRADAERAQRNPRAFVDVTFSAPKSASVLAAAYERAALDARRAGDELGAARYAARVRVIEDGMRAGSAAALARMARVAGQARVGHHGGGAGRWSDAGGWVIASFLQHDSRDHDPQLHVHNAILNRQLCADGQWRALDCNAIRAAKLECAAVGERVFEAYVSARLGVVWATREDGAAREIVGVSQTLRDQFSARRRAIAPKAAELVRAFAAKLGRAPNLAERHKINQQACLATRRSKSHTAETVDQRLDRWQAEAATDTRDGLAAAIAGAERAGAEAGPAPAWSEHDVIAQALAGCEQYARWTRAELTFEVSRALPGNLGLPDHRIESLIDALTDRALAQAVRLTPAESTDGLPAELLRADGRSAYDSGLIYYATTDQLAAERVLAERAADAGAEAFTAAEADQVLAQLTATGRNLGVDQAAAVRGVLTSGAALEVITAPAGTGKSYVVGVLAEAWTDQSIAPHAGGPRRVVGLATSQAAANVLADEGLSATANIDAWLAAQQCIEQGRARDGDEALRLRADDLVVLDEAGMVSTGHFREVADRCQAVGARLLAVGDPAQLRAVGAGGALADLVGSAPTHELTEVRRFAEKWEATASLGLRDGDASVVADYDRHGRLVDGGNAERTEALACRRWLADHLNGRDTLLLATTNAAVDRLNAAARAELIRLGHVTEHGVTLGRNGETAGVGDLVQARRNGRGTDAFAGRSDPPVNRDVLRVLSVSANGSLTVARVLSRDGGVERLADPTMLPAGYVAEHLSLGYASTVHTAQGRTVDTAHAVIGAGADPAGTYVALSRGRAANTAYAVTVAVGEDEPTGAANEVPRQAPGAVLAQAITREDTGTDLSATATARFETERAASVATALDRLAVELSEATAGRTGRTLDRLAANGALTAEQRAALAADSQTMARIERLLRAGELAGRDPAQALAEAVTERPLDCARHVGHALYWRLSGHGSGTRTAATLSSYTALVPGGLDERTRTRLLGLAEDGDDRRRELGARCSADPPGWALAALGPIPDEPMEAFEWEQRAGWAAAYRELVGWADKCDPIGPAPAGTHAEHRAAWRAAHQGLGVDTAASEVHELSDGALLVRVAAAERVRDWAPAWVADHQGDAQRAATASGTDATLWAAYGATTDPHGRANLDREAALARLASNEHAARADQLDAVHDVYSRWLATNAVTLENGQQAREALTARGLDPASRDHRVTADEWLAADAHARREDDAHRDIGEHDLSDHERDDKAAASAAGEPEAGVPTAADQLHRHAHEDTDRLGARRALTDAEVVAEATRALTVAAELASFADLAARDEQRRERERCWHDDDRSAARQVDDDDQGDVLVMER